MLCRLGLNCRKCTTLHGNFMMRWLMSLSVLIIFSKTMQGINNISPAFIIQLFHFNLLCSGPRSAEGVFIFAGVITLEALTAQWYLHISSIHSLVVVSIYLIEAFCISIMLSRPSCFEKITIEDDFTIYLSTSVKTTVAISYFNPCFVE